jgi:hypothetical protein
MKAQNASVRLSGERRVCFSDAPWAFPTKPLQKRILAQIASIQRVRPNSGAPPQP